MQSVTMRICCSQHQGDFVLNLLKDNILAYCLESNLWISFKITMPFCIDNNGIHYLLQFQCSVYLSVAIENKERYINQRY